MSVHFPESLSLHPSWLSDACATRKDSKLGWLAKDHPETNPITIKPETTRHEAEQIRWVPWPSCSPPGCPFPIKSLALSAWVSSDNSFPSVRQEPSFGPWKGSPFLQQIHQNNIAVLNASVPSNRALKCMKWKLTELKGGRGNSRIKLQDNTPLLSYW